MQTSMGIERRLMQRLRGNQVSGVLKIGGAVAGGLYGGPLGAKAGYEAGGMVGDAVSGNNSGGSSGSGNEDKLAALEDLRKNNSYGAR